MKQFIRAIKRLNGKFTMKVGGAVARSYCEDLGDVKGNAYAVRVVAATNSQLHQVIRALDLLRYLHDYAFNAVTRWVRLIGFTRSKCFRFHFCDGTVLIRSVYDLPDTVLAAFLYRLAVEIILAKRFGRWEVVVGDPRCRLIALRKQRAAMMKLECPHSYIEEHDVFISNEERRLK